jgi:hypothetical protein
MQLVILFNLVFLDVTEEDKLPGEAKKKYGKFTD